MIRAPVREKCAFEILACFGHAGIVEMFDLRHAVANHGYTFVERAGHNIIACGLAYQKNPAPVVATLLGDNISRLKLTCWAKSVFWSIFAATSPLWCIVYTDALAISWQWLLSASEKVPRRLRKLWQLITSGAWGHHLEKSARFAPTLRTCSKTLAGRLDCILTMITEPYPRH